MSEMTLDSEMLSPDSLDARSFDVYCESQEEILTEMYGLSAIKKSSGILCLMCMKFFLDDIAAEAHARNLLHYQHYNIGLHENGTNYYETHTIVDALYGDGYSCEEECCDEYSSSDAIGDNLSNELVTIRKCSGILCSACKKFFVNETSAGQHVKSWEHYKQCYDGKIKDNITQQVEMKKNTIGENGLNSCGREVKINKESSAEKVPNGSTPGLPDLEVHLIQSDEADLQINKQDSKEDRNEGNHIQDLEPEDSKVDSLLNLDNDWWCDFDSKLATLLNDINNEFGE